MWISCHCVFFHPFSCPQARLCNSIQTRRQVKIRPSNWHFSFCYKNCNAREIWNFIKKNSRQFLHIQFLWVLSPFLEVVGKGENFIFWIWKSIVFIVVPSEFYPNLLFSNLRKKYTKLISFFFSSQFSIF